MDLAERIEKLNQEQRRLLELELKQQGVDILQIPISQEYREKYDPFPLSEEQEPWWTAEPIDPFDPRYDVTGPVGLEGNLDIELLEKCINEVVKRHEILRLVFVMNKDKLAQVILPSLTLRLQRIDLKGLPGNEQEQRIKQLREDNRLYAFDLAKGPLVKIILLELSESQNILITVMHHIISDLLSLKIFLKEVAWFYVTSSPGKPPGFDLPGLGFQYVDYACWQQHWYRESIAGIIARKKQEEFWLEMFKGEIPVLNLPTDYPRPARKSYEGEHGFFLVKEEEIKALKKIFLKENATLYVLVLSILYVFLAKISGQEDIVVGTLINTRQNKALNDMIGLFVKKVPLRNYPRGSKTFGDFLTGINQQVLDVYKNQDYPYEELVKKIVKKQDPGRSPLFDVLLNFIYIDISEVEMPGLKVRPYTLKTKRVGYDLELVCEGSYKELFFKLSYSTKLFKEETIGRFISYFQKIIASIIKNQGIKISEIEIIP
jgi:surfactin family lipopeptide synthetase A